MHGAERGKLVQVDLINPNLPEERRLIRKRRASRRSINPNLESKTAKKQEMSEMFPHLFLQNQSPAFVGNYMFGDV